MWKSLCRVPRPTRGFIFVHELCINYQMLVSHDFFAFVLCNFCCDCRCYCCWCLCACLLVYGNHNRGALFSHVSVTSYFIHYSCITCCTLPIWQKMMLLFEMTMITTLKTVFRQAYIYNVKIFKDFFPSKEY